MSPPGTFKNPLVSAAPDSMSGDSLNDLSGTALNHSSSSAALAGHSDPEQDWNYEKEEKRYCWGRLNRRNFLLLMLCLINFVIGAIILGACFPLITHAVGQSALNGAGITFSTMDITSIDGYNLNTTISGNLTNNAGINGAITPFPVDLSFNGVTFGSIVLPALNVPTGQSQFTISTVIALVPPGTTFVAFAQALIANTSVSFSLNGTATLIASVGSSITVPNLSFNKVITVPGVGGLDLQIGNFNLPNDVPGGLALTATAGLNNPSITSMVLGDLTFSIYYENTYQGSIYMPNFELVRGQSSVAASGIVNPSPADKDATSAFFSNYLLGNPVDLVIEGDLTYPASSPAYLRQLVQSLALSSTLVGHTSQSLIGGITLQPPLYVSLLNNQEPTLSGGVMAQVNNPFAFSFVAKSFELTMGLSYNNGAIGFINVGESAIGPNNGTDLVLPFAGNLQVTSTANFQAFVQDLLLLSELSTAASGLSNVTITVGFGDVTLMNIPFAASLNLLGLNDFPQGVSLSPIAVTNGTSTSISFTLNATIFNPANVVSTFNSISFDTYAGGTNDYLGYCVTKGTSVTLNLKNNTFALSCIFDTTNPRYSAASVQTILSNFVNQQNSLVDLRGTAPVAGGATNVVLQTALEKVFISGAVVLGLTSNIVTGVSVTGVDITPGTTGSDTLGITTTIYANNPVAVPLTITAMDLNAYYIDTSENNAAYNQIGVILLSPLPTPVTIPGYGSGTVTDVPLVDYLPYFSEALAFGASWLIKSTTIKLKAVGTISVLIGGFPAVLNFTESNLSPYPPTN